MPDGTSPALVERGPLYHYMGTSTFASHAVLAGDSGRQDPGDAPFEKVCYIGCGVTTASAR
jgi:S-(hydroxymethyl)glutathione dehydrogenase/alcohol dehydrogenase